MSESPEVANNELTLEELANQFRAFREDSEERIHALTFEIARLTGRALDGEAQKTNSPKEPQLAIEPVVTDGSGGVGPLSRRGALLALGGAAAGGMGVAIGSTFLGVDPAAAANPSLILDQSNTGTATTALTGDLASFQPLLQITNTSSGSAGSVGGMGIMAQSGSGSAVVGFSTADSGAGVVGEIDSTTGGYGVVGTAVGVGTGVFGEAGTNGVGVYGTANGGSGLLGTQAAGVVGDSNNFEGVLGLSHESHGVVGSTSILAGNPGAGVYGSLAGNLSGLLATRQGGVIGDAGTLDGVIGLSNSANGILGMTHDPGGNGGSGVFGTLSAGQSGLLSNQVAGVIGDSGSSVGVIGLSSTTDGVSGQTVANGQNGVAGIDSSAGGGNGIAGVSLFGTGVFGATQAAGVVGVLAENTDGPSLGLVPFGTATLPATSSPGQFIVLSDGSLHYCETVNEWILLGSSSTSPSVVTIDPVRVINTTTGEGGITGPLVPGSTVHTSSVIPGTNGIPLNATGILANFAISGVGGALLNGFGTATIFPAGIATPATANINSGAGCFAISNAVSVGFGTGGSAGKLSIVWGGGGPVPNAEAFLDVTGYIL